MPKFSYEAINETGMTIEGVIEAESLDAARTLLLNRGYIPSRVVGASERGEIFGMSWEKLQQRISGVTMQEIILFTKQFGTMSVAGDAIMRTLDCFEV